MAAVFDGERNKGTIKRRLLRWLLFFSGIATIVVGMIGLVAWGIFARDVPDFDSLDDYRPMLVTRVFDQSGQLIGEFYRERRIVLPHDQIPPKLVQAVLASEDDRFFEHRGID